MLINPQIKGCSVGILVRAGGFKLLADKSKVGYASAASPAIGNNYRGVYFDRGSFDYEIKGLNEGELFMRNNYIPINLQAGYDCLIADTHIDHPNPLDWALHREVVREPPRQGRYQGPRRLHPLARRRSLLPRLRDPLQRRCGLRGGGHLPGRQRRWQRRRHLGAGLLALSAVDAATDTVTLAQPPGGQWSNLQNAQGAWLSFNQGGAVGRYLKIVGVNAASLKLTLSDPNDYLSLAAAGDPVSVTAPYRNVTISENDGKRGGGSGGDRFPRSDLP